MASALQRRQAALLERLVGGDYKNGRLLIRDHPELRTMWTYETLNKMRDQLSILEFENSFNSKVKLAIRRYYDLRGEEGALRHCLAYDTSEESVILNLMREGEIRLMGRQVTVALNEWQDSNHNGNVAPTRREMEEILQMLDEGWVLEEDHV